MEAADIAGPRGFGIGEELLILSWFIPETGTSPGEVWAFLEAIFEEVVCKKLFRGESGQMSHSKSTHRSQLLLQARRYSRCLMP